MAEHQETSAIIKVPPALADLIAVNVGSEVLFSAAIGVAGLSNIGERH
jgi:hypothetical protein